MPYSYFLEGAALSLPMAAFIFFTLRWVAARPHLQTEINPKTGQPGPPFLCRGGWNEGEIRGCEHGYVHTGIPVEPVNTYSNLAYVVAGWVAYRILGGGTGIVFFCAMAILCVGSALYHGVKTRWSARWDHGGMYAVIGGLGFYVVAAGHPQEMWFVLVGSAASGVVLAFILDGHLLARMGLLMALVSVGVLTRGHETYGWYSLGCFALAMTVWIVDKKTGVLGRFGHGLWHLFTAAALAIMFLAVRPPA